MIFSFIFHPETNLVKGNTDGIISILKIKKLFYSVCKLNTRKVIFLHLYLLKMGQWAKSNN